MTETALAEAPDPRSHFLSGTFLQWVVTEKGCWIPNIKPNAKGYCYIQPGGRKGKKVRLHRHSWECFNRCPTTPGMFVLHTCDNRACFNPDHLYEGTAQNNTDDMMIRGRNKYIKPDTTKIKNGKLSLAIQLENEGVSRPNIAKRLGVSYSTIWNYLSEKGPYYG